MAPNRKFYTFLHISVPHPLLFKNILHRCIELPQCYISCSWLLRCTLWLEHIMAPNLKFSSLLKHYLKIPITFLIINQIQHVTLCYKEHGKSFIWYCYAYDISKAILDLDPDLCENFPFSTTLSILHIQTCMIPLMKAVQGLYLFSYT